MAFLKVYNCIPGSQSRLSVQLLEDWDRYDILKLPKLRLVLFVCILNLNNYC